MKTLTANLLRQVRFLLRRIARPAVAASVLTLSIPGCLTDKATVCDLQYCDDIEGICDYRDQVASIEYPCIDTPTPEAVASSYEPRNLNRRNEDKPREMTLQEALRTALSQNEIIETSALGGVGSKAVLTNPTAASSVYDPAIQSSGVLFGRRSVETALSDFDTTFTTSITGGRLDMNAGGSFAGEGNFVNFRSGLAKQFANGSSLTLNNDWNYTNDLPDYAPKAGPGRPINYFGEIGAQFRQPLLSGSGVEYTRIAGPANPNFGAITGVSQGVVIARINEDISIADFEIAVRNAMRDIEAAYWDLYLAYRTYDTAVVAHQSAMGSWKIAFDLSDVGNGTKMDELQAREQLYETKAAVETSLSTLYKSEAELRRLIGMPMNDGTVLVPVDEPALAEFQPDWQASLRQALTYRVELRRQKWNVKSLQLQLQAARTLVRPRLDFIAGYDLQGAGDRFISQGGGLNSAVGALKHGNIDSWNLGLEMSMPIGFRFARSQVRNLELQLAKATAVLASQEKNIAHDVATAIQDVTSAYAAAQSNYKRLQASIRRVTLEERRYKAGGANLDPLLRAQSSRAQAEASYYREVANYNQSLVSLNLATGRLLDMNGISLAEGPWCPEAQCDALLRAQARTHAKDAPHLGTRPDNFTSHHPTGGVELQTVPESARHEFPETGRTQELDLMPEGDVPAVPADGAQSRFELERVNPSLLELEPIAPPIRSAFRDSQSGGNFSEDFPESVIE